MKYTSLIIALIGLMVLSLYPISVAHADSNVPKQTTEWAGIKNIMSVMGQGTLNAADQKSLLDILDVKSAVEEERALPSLPGSVRPVQPVSGAAQKLPPRHRPSAF